MSSWCWFEWAARCDVPAVDRKNIRIYPMSDIEPVACAQNEMGCGADDCCIETSKEALERVGQGARSWPYHFVKPAQSVGEDELLAMLRAWRWGVHRIVHVIYMYIIRYAEERDDIVHQRARRASLPSNTVPSVEAIYTMHITRPSLCPCPCPYSAPCPSCPLQTSPSPPALRTSPSRHQPPTPQTQHAQAN